MSEQLKNKILNMEVAPPAAAWDFIAAELDKQAVSGAAGVQLKMHEMEVTPPAFVWNEIEKELDKNAEKVVPINRNSNFIFLRYAAAAVVVGLIGLFVFRYFNNNQTIQPSNSSTEALAKVDNQTIEFIHRSLSEGGQSNNTDNDTNRTPETTTNISSQPSSTSNRLPLETKDLKEIYAFNELKLQPSGIEERLFTGYNPEEEVRLVARDVKGNIPSGINAVTAGNNYFITTGPNGEVVRVSNKLMNIIQMLGDDESTRENIDQIIEESAVWKQRFYNLRSRLSKLSPSPGNFMDIIQLTKALNEEKRP